VLVEDPETPDLDEDEKDEDYLRNLAPFGSCLLQNNVLTIFINPTARMPDGKMQDEFTLANTIAHECLHAVLQLQDAAEADVIDYSDNNEHLTYMIGSLTEMTHRALAILMANKKETKDAPTDSGTTSDSGKGKGVVEDKSKKTSDASGRGSGDGKVDDNQPFGA
jgi:hypothetical protein